MTLATSKKSPLLSPTIKKDRAAWLTNQILEMGDKIGSYLCEMRDSAGYRHLGYKDFVTYCQTEFGHSKSRAYQLIDEAQIEQELRQESKILENRKLPGSQLRVLKDVAPSDRASVVELADKLAEQKHRQATADDLKAAAFKINGGSPNTKKKWKKALSELGFKEGVEVLANPHLPTKQKGVIKKVREDGRVQVYLYGFNTEIGFSIGELELATPRTHIPLSYEESYLNQEVRIFSEKVKTEETGLIVGRLKEFAVVEIGHRQYEIPYEDLALANNDIVQNQPPVQIASEATVEVEAREVEDRETETQQTETQQTEDNFNWVSWTRKWLTRLTEWLAANATDQQRLDIFLALAEKLSAEAREVAIAIFGGMADGNEFAAYKHLAQQKIESLEREVASLNKAVGVQLEANNQLTAWRKKSLDEYFELEKEVKELRKVVEQAQSKAQKIEKSITSPKLTNSDEESSQPEIDSVQTRPEIANDNVSSVPAEIEVKSLPANVEEEIIAGEPSKEKLEQIKNLKPGDLLGIEEGKPFIKVVQAGKRLVLLKSISGNKEQELTRDQILGYGYQVISQSQTPITEATPSNQDNHSVEESLSTPDFEVGDRISLTKRVLTPFQKVKIQGLLAQKPLMTQEIVETLGDSYSEVMETLTRLKDEGIVCRQMNHWHLINVDQKEATSTQSAQPDPTTTNDTNTFEVGDRIQIIQPEGWCEIAYANPGQLGTVQGKAKKGGYNVLLDEPPAPRKRQDITLTANRIKLVEQLPSSIDVETIDATSALVQQIADTRVKLTQKKEKLEQELKSATTQPERNKFKKELTYQAQSLAHIETFSNLKIGETVGRHRSIERGIIQQLDFSPGGMPQVWVMWENWTVMKPEAVSSIKILGEGDLLAPTTALLGLEEFEKQLIPYVASNGAKNPYAYAHTIVKNVREGLPSSLYDDFLAGRPLGSQVKRDWEIVPGINIPALEEERIQYYIHKGEPIEQATLKAREELRNPTTAQALCDGFLRKCDRLTDEAIKAKDLGVQTPYLPPSFTDKPEVTKESVGAKLEALHAPETADQIIETSEIPTLESLRESYSKPVGKNLIERAIRENPHWGYILANGIIERKDEWLAEVGEEG